MKQLVVNGDGKVVNVIPVRDDGVSFDPGDEFVVVEVVDDEPATWGWVLVEGAFLEPAPPQPELEPEPEPSTAELAAQLKDQLAMIDELMMMMLEG